MRKQIIEDLIGGCAPIAAGFILAAIFCILITMCGCKPTEKIIEVEKWQHDTTTVIDTLRITDTRFVHDSVYVTEYLTEYVKDSTLTNVAWKYYTYDSVGNISSLLDYTSSTQHGSVAHTASQNASTSVSNQSSIHEEASGHSESQGHSSIDKSKEKTKVGLTKWQKFIMGMGYIFFIGVVLALMFGGMMLYGKYKKL